MFRKITSAEGFMDIGTEEDDLDESNDLDVMSIQDLINN